MVDIRPWPARALEIIEEMIRNSLIEVLQGFEHEGQRVTAIYMNRPMMNVWRVICDRHERQRFDAMTGQRESDMFYGVPIEMDRNLDPRHPQPNDHVEGRIRMVSRGRGSEPVDFDIQSRPEALRYDIRMRSRHQTRAQSFTYNYVRQDDRLRHIDEGVHEAVARQMPVQNMTAGEYQAQEAKRQPRPKEMSDLMIAWLT